MKKFLSILLVIFFIFGCSSEKKNEKYYQTKICEKLDGILEYKLKDKSRVDCLTDKYAIEVDWANKWAEAVGQSLYYSQMTDKQAAIALISSSNDDKFIKRVKFLAKKFNIKIFIIDK